MEVEKSGDWKGIEGDHDAHGAFFNRMGAEQSDGPTGGRRDDDDNDNKLLTAVLLSTPGTCSTTTTFLRLVTTCPPDIAPSIRPFTYFTPSGPHQTRFRHQERHANALSLEPPRLEALPGTSLQAQVVGPTNVCLTRRCSLTACNGERLWSSSSSSSSCCFFHHHHHHHHHRHLTTTRRRRLLQNKTTASLKHFHLHWET
ncbi:hypothetical protein JOL62DRAFT_332088 [Phyllosticta paracitricarpa]|uniref:Uncharacterized protein n=2 Tax=Phyllosticta TaxID=121621 RepID=A0ABR1M4Z9_9PEZI